MITADDKNEIQKLIDQAFTDRSNENRDYYLNQRDKVELVEKVSELKVDFVEKINGTEAKLIDRLNLLNIDMAEKISGVKTKIDGNFKWTVSIGIAILMGLITLIFKAYTAK